MIVRIFDLVFAHLASSKPIPAAARPQRLFPALCVLAGLLFAPNPAPAAWKAIGPDSLHDTATEACTVSAKHYHSFVHTLDTFEPGPPWNTCGMHGTGGLFKIYELWGYWEGKSQPVCGVGLVEDWSQVSGCRKAETYSMCGVGNPIVPLSGTKVEAAADYRSSGPRPLELVRHYNSTTHHMSRFGPGWASNLDGFLIVGASIISVHRPNGTRARFDNAAGYAPVEFETGSARSDVAWTLEKDGENWVFTDESDTVETYDPSGNLLSITYRDGYTLDFRFDENANNFLVIDSFGRTLQFTFSIGGLVTSMTDPDGRVTKYEYEDTSNFSDPTISVSDGAKTPVTPLAKVIYPDDTPLTDTDNPTVTYHYEDTDLPSALTGITDENNVRYATWDYDADGNATLSKHAGDVDEYTLSYDTTNDKTTVTNPLGKDTVYHYEESQFSHRITKIEGVASTNCAASDTTYTYDSNGYVDTTTDGEGRVTDFTHNGDGLETQRVEAQGTADERTITTTWHNDLRVPTKIERPGLTTDYTYDTDGRLTELKLTDETNHLVPYATNGDTRTWTYAYTEVAPDLSPSADEESITLTNAGAESGDLTGWTSVIGDFQVNYSPSGCPEGSYCFYGGDADDSEIQQTVTLPSSVTSQLGADMGVLKLSWSQSGLRAHNDPGWMRLTFFDDQDVQTGSAVESEWSAYTNWWSRALYADPPSDAVKVRIDAVCERVGASGRAPGCDFYFDDVVLSWENAIELPVVNPGAEAGSMTGWTTETGGWGITINWATAADGEAAFRSSPGAENFIYQDIAIPTALESQVDADLGTVHLGWWQENYTDTKDLAGAILVFLDGTSTEIGRKEAPMIADWNMFERSLNAPIPSGTRTVRIKLRSIDSGGGGNDATIDLVTLNYIGPSLTPTKLLTSIDGPLAGTGDTVTYDYTDQGYLEKVTDEAGHITEVTAHNDSGQPLTVKDANGVETDFVYNERGWVTSITVNPGASEAVTSFTYDDVGQVTRITRPDGSYLDYTYSDARRLTRIENNAGEKIEYAYDDMGNVTDTDIKTSGGTLKFAQDQTFDELGRVLKTIGAGLQETAYAYDKVDNLTQVTDPRSKVYGYAFDPLNRLIKETDPDLYETDYAYDGDGDLTQVEDARSNATDYVVNGFGETIREVSPDSGTTDYEYDAAGNVTKITDARGIVTNFSYDDLSRILSKTFPASVGENVTYTYDSITGGNYGKGRLTSISDESGSTSFVYDARGNVVEETRVVGTVNYVTAYDYDLADNLTRVTYPSGRIVSYTRNSVGQITTVKMQDDDLAPEVTVASAIAYAPFGPMTGLTFGNGLGLTLTYDQDYRVTDIDTVEGLTTIQDLTLAYDAASNITSITDNEQTARNQTFTYDDLNRLLSADGAYGDIDYTYDGVGNRLTRAIDTGSIVTETSTIALTSNRLSQVDDGSVIRGFSYDNAGNVTLDDGVVSLTLAYNHAGRLENVKQGVVDVATYAYNAMEQQVARTVHGSPDVTTHRVHDLAGRILVDADDTGAAIRETIWLGDLPIAIVDHSGVSQATYYIHTDHLGSPQKLTDDTDSVVWDGQFLPFGQEHSITGSATNLLRFPGQTWDDETQYHQNWHRDYDPSIGRYLQSDPLGLVDGPNTYAYALGNPVINSDPTGEAVPLAVFVGRVAYGGYRAYRAYRARQAARKAIEAARKARQAAATASTVAQIMEDDAVPDDPAEEAKEEATKESPQQCPLPEGDPDDEDPESNEPDISPQKQAGHVDGTPQHTNRVKQGKATSTFSDARSGERLTREAWRKGKPLPGRPNVREYDFGVKTGRGPNGGTQTRVRVHQDGSGRIHGHPSGPETF